MITYEDLMKLSIKELKDVTNMAQDIRIIKGKQLVKNMPIGTEFSITGNKNVGKRFILKKVNRTKVVASLKGENVDYTIPFAMIIVE